jgi:hypothetical protein
MLKLTYEKASQLFVCLTLLFWFANFFQISPEGIYIERVEMVEGARSALFHASMSL